MAQIEKARDLAGKCFSHVDFHMGLHRLPRLYPLFLEVAAASRTGGFERIGTSPEWRVGIRAFGTRSTCSSGQMIPKYGWNLSLRWRAARRGFVMPDYWLSISNMGRPGTITLANYCRLLRNLPRGVSEFVAHPAYVDEELRRWSTYIEQREEERRILTNDHFRNAIGSLEVRLLGYRDLPVWNAETPAA